MSKNNNPYNLPELKIPDVLGCPFCGEKPKVIKAFNDRAIVICMGSDCDMLITTKGGRDFNIEQAVEVWNKRQQA